MTFKEQIKPYMYCYMGSGMLSDTYDEGVADECAERVEQIADEFAIGFAEWLTMFTQEFEDGDLRYWNKNRWERKSTKELLEIYKKEQEL